MIVLSNVHTQKSSKSNIVGQVESSEEHKPAPMQLLNQHCCFINYFVILGCIEQTGN